MLVPLTRAKFEQLVPRIATGPQYLYYWGKFPDFLRRLLISLIGVVISYFAIRPLLGESFEGISFLLGLVAGLYWLWNPVYFASIKNGSLRKYKYSGFWRGEILDLYITEEFVKEEQTVNSKGELVIIENRERRLNIEVGDETGFSTQLQVPLKKTHKMLKRGYLAEMLVVSQRENLSRIDRTSNIYIPELNIWVTDYPYLREDLFVDIGRYLSEEESPPPPKRSSSSKRRPRQE